MTAFYIEKYNHLIVEAGKVEHFIKISSGSILNSLKLIKDGRPTFSKN